MAVRGIGVLFFLVGTLLSFGAYHLLAGGEIVTAASLFVPAAFLITGLGLIRFKGWAKYFGVYFSGLCLLLGFLDFNGLLSATDFLPIVPIIRAVPDAILKWNWEAISITSFFILPVLVIVILNLRRVDNLFEPELGGYFSCRSPFLVMAAGVFVFSYDLLVASKISFFLIQESRTIMGFSVSPLQGTLLSYVECFALIILAFGLLDGGAWIWFLGILLSIYYWFALPETETQFLFRTGWTFVGVACLGYSYFFWRTQEWLRSRRIHRTNPILSMILMVTLGVAAFAGGIYYWAENILPAISNSQTPNAPAKALRKPRLRINGTAVDSGGSYAIVNGVIVQVGEKVDGYRIEAIEAKKIRVVDENGKRYWLDRKGHWKDA